MTRLRPSVSPSVLIFLSLAITTPALAQSFGLGDQVLTIGAAEFHREAGGVASTYNAEGYLTGSGSYVASLRLPDGAQVFGICIDAYKNELLDMISGRIEAVRLPDTGQMAGLYPVPGALAFAPNEVGFDYASACNLSPVSYTFHDVGNVDGVGDRRLAHRVFVSVQGGSRLGAMRILWRRQVSPPPGSATFGDVPTSDSAFSFVEALVAAGVTAGCGGGDYCPDAPLTRRQMAVFLSKALGLHWTH